MPVANPSQCDKGVKDALDISEGSQWGVPEGAGKQSRLHLTQVHQTQELEFQLRFSLRRHRPGQAGSAQGRELIWDVLYGLAAALPVP